MRIGVIARASECAVVREFFQLFKTPWEFFREDGHYDVVLYCGDGEASLGKGTLTMVYGGRPTEFDARQCIRIASQNARSRLLSFSEIQVPIYGENVTFGEDNSPSGIVSLRVAGKAVVRVGYDLFGEVRTLMTAGQPASNAAIPALDLHICVLRDAIVANGLRLVEIPPIPDGRRYIACLTHDLDHPLLRRHRFDRTMFGFLYRATLGSLLRFARRRLRVRALLGNWVAVLKLPLVHLGLAKDFWHEFDRYTELENGSASTFFVIPFEGRAGRNAPKSRAARYGAAAISDKLRALRAAGCEIGLHGIDAWQDASEGRRESEEVRRVTGQGEIGARMHWLYSDQESPITLERAGVVYDSTVGYNETIGFRAGTTQVYKPPGTRSLLEVPLHIMDTALFYPSHLDLSPRQAWDQVRVILSAAVEQGGCITVNWHDRSIVPERQWGCFYSELIETMRSQGAQFATAAQSVSWFRMRRSAVFEDVTWESDRVRTSITVNSCTGVPGLLLRVHQAAESSVDVPINREISGSHNPDYPREYVLDIPLTPCS